MVHVIRSKAATQQMAEMMEAPDPYIKLAVDIRRGVLAGGGVMHADCEAALLEDGSQQEGVWGADWTSASQQVTFEPLINIRPRQGTRSLDIQDPEIRSRVAQITLDLFGGV